MLHWEELMKATCPACHAETRFHRGAHVQATTTGVWITFRCEHCDAELVIQARDKNLRNPGHPPIMR
jgi:hypothetical protein